VSSTRALNPRLLEAEWHPMTCSWQHLPGPAPAPPPLAPCPTASMVGYENCSTPAAGSTTV
jgi:hypothetical protein